MVELLALAVVDIACGLLIVAGVMKLSTRGAFERLTAVAELAVAVTALVVGGRVGFVALWVMYGALVVMAARLLLHGAPSCNCFGERAAPPSWTHVVVNAVAATVAGVLVATDPEPMVARLGPGAAAAIAYLAFVAIGVAAAVALLTGAPALAEARRLVARP